MILSVAYAQQFAAALPPAVPLKVGNNTQTATTPTANQTNTSSPFILDQSSPVESAFNQLVSQMVADSVSSAPETILPHVNMTQSVKSPLTAPLADQSPVLPESILPPVGGHRAAAITAPGGEPPVVPESPLPPVAKTSEQPIPSAIPVGTRRTAASNTQPATTDKVQAHAVAVDVDLPIVITPKLQAPPLTGDGGSEAKPVIATTAPKAEEPIALTLQPRPVLEVKIHLNQAETPPPAQAPAPPVKSPVPTTQNVTADLPVQSVPDRGINVAAVTTKSSRPGEPAVNAQSATPVQSKRTPDSNADPQRQSSSRGGSESDTDSKPVAQSGVQVGVQPARQTAPHDAASLQNPTVAPPQQAAVPAVAHAQNIPAAVAGAAQAPTAPPPSPVIAREAKAESQTSSAPVREEVPIDQTRAPQPMRSLSLEFTPDGARDIKVRLSEKGGEVHISLHGTDPSLASRVREGVGDLVGSLSKAGYDAEAWTPDQGRQNQRQQPEQRKTTRNTSAEASAEDFSGMLQPIQEIK